MLKIDFQKDVSQYIVINCFRFRIKGYGRKLKLMLILGAFHEHADLDLATVCDPSVANIPASTLKSVAADAVVVF